MSSAIHKPVAIIGAGPAGLSAAIQLRRYKIDFFLFERKRLGGLLNNANLVENYLGFPKGIIGEKLCRLMAKHLRTLSIKPIQEEVINVQFLGNKYILNAGVDYSANYCILATGTKPVVPDFITPEVLKTGKVFFEIADCRFIKDSDVVIIGGGDAAFDYALNLRKNGNEITVISRSGFSKALPLLFDRAKKTGIKTLSDAVCKEIIFENNELNVICQNNSFKADFVLCATGRAPELGCMNPNDYSSKIGRTLFPVGDVKNWHYRQVAIAAGDGLRAAMEIHNLINN